MISVGVMAGCLAFGGACDDGRTQRAAAHQVEPRPVCRVERVTRRLGRRGEGDYGTVVKGPVDAGIFRGPTALAYGGVTRLGPPMRGERKRILKFPVGLRAKWGASATIRAIRIDTGQLGYWTYSHPTRGPGHLVSGYVMRLPKKFGTPAGGPGGVIVPGAGCYRLETRTAGKVLNLYFEVPDEQEPPLPSR